MEQEQRTEVSIPPLLERACGLDMHKEKIVAFVSNKDGTDQELKEFGTFTHQLYALKEWLQSHRIKHCLMESTGIYWMSLYSILTEAGIDVVVANPTQIKQIPKRKTDRKDARWLCTLLLHGLVRRSFIAGALQIQLRDYCRSRLFYSWQRTKLFNRTLKILESNNIKLRSVISSVNTQTGMGIVKLLAQGVTDKEQLLACARGSVKAKKEKLSIALEGTLKAHHQLQLQMLHEDIEHINHQLERLEKAIRAIVSDHYAEVTECLDSISGIGAQSAEIIISEVGDDMSHFPTADHLTSWCGLAPGNCESAGKAKNVAVRKGNKYLRLAIIAAAWAAVRTKDSYWRALFDKLRKRMKSQKAIVAVARRLLKVVYKTIRDKCAYEEKGVMYFLSLQSRRSSLLVARVLDRQVR